MKYENFEEAQGLVETINKYRGILKKSKKSLAILKEIT